MLGEGGGEVHLCLLVLRPVERQLELVAQLLERLTQPGDVPVAEDAPDAGDESLLDPIALAVLGRHEPDDRLAHREPDLAHAVAPHADVASCLAVVEDSPPEGSGAIDYPRPGWPGLTRLSIGSYLA